TRCLRQAIAGSAIIRPRCCRRDRSLRWGAAVEGWSGRPDCNRRPPAPKASSGSSRCGRRRIESPALPCVRFFGEDRRADDEGLPGARGGPSMPKRLASLLAGAAVLFFGSPAFASFHLVKIE